MLQTATHRLSTALTTAYNTPTINPTQQPTHRNALLSPPYTPSPPQAAAVAASALRNLAIDTPAATDAVLAAGGRGLPSLIRLLRAGPDRDVTLQAAGALCNMADGPAAREAIADAGAVGPLVALLVTCNDLELPAVAAGASADRPRTVRGHPTARPCLPCHPHADSPLLSPPSPSHTPVSNHQAP